MELRPLTADEVTFSLEIEEDDVPIKGSFSSGDDDRDRELTEELTDRLQQGDLWAWCCVKITATWENWKGTSYLGGCSYNSEKDFVENSGYAEDMKNEALRDLNESLARVAMQLQKLQKV